MHVEVGIGLITSVQKSYNHLTVNRLAELQSTEVTLTFLSELGAFLDILRHNQLHQRLNVACRFLVSREPHLCRMQETHC